LVTSSKSCCKRLFAFCKTSLSLLSFSNLEDNSATSCSREAFNFSNWIIFANAASSCLLRSLSSVSFLRRASSNSALAFPSSSKWSWASLSSVSKRLLVLSRLALFSFSAANWTLTFWISSSSFLIILPRSPPKLIFFSISSRKVLVSDVRVLIAASWASRAAFSLARVSLVSVTSVSNFFLTFVASSLAVLSLSICSWRSSISANKSFFCLSKAAPASISASTASCCSLSSCSKVLFLCF